MNKSFTQADLAQQINNMTETKLYLILYLGFFMSLQHTQLFFSLWRILLHFSLQSAF